uniref:Uncharacterized protein n=1 Tax=Romanomermis culicivorax TaxID=13658 RepID=A0A915JBX1_ROMCU
KIDNLSILSVKLGILRKILKIKKPRIFPEKPNFNRKKRLVCDKFHKFSQKFTKFSKKRSIWLKNCHFFLEKIDNINSLVESFIFFGKFFLFFEMRFWPFEVVKFRGVERSFSKNLAKKGEKLGQKFGFFLKLETYGILARKFPNSLESYPQKKC